MVRGVVYIGKSQHPTCPSIIAHREPIAQHPASGHSMEVGHRNENVFLGINVPGTVFEGARSPSIAPFSSSTDSLS